ncbi:hypothetical protein [Chlorogloeopsis sp. ULAP02]|uniref:hypothetical protein n=1 Tax=Chlorogloeopsis sp. ULAP02 TaxID=3107926 RepID=UPI00313748DA
MARSLQSGLGVLSVGNFALFVYYLSFMTGFLDYLGRFMILCKQTEDSFERLTTVRRVEKINFQFERQDYQQNPHAAVLQVGGADAT